MELMVGYKQTEVGVIPEDWRTAKIAELSYNITVGFVGSMSFLFVNEGVPLLRGLNILPHSLDLANHKYISRDTHISWKKSALKPNDVVIVRVGYPGTACVIPNGLGDLNAASLVIVRPNQDVLDSNFLCYVLNSTWGIAQIQGRLVGGAQQVFNTSTAAELVIQLPKPAEQHAIAAALSDVDALIAALDRLIAKKRDIKQAAMQELLTGKRRLPGFAGGNGYKQTDVGMIPVDWEVKAIADIAEVKGGKRLPLGKCLSDTMTTHPYIRVTDMCFGGVSLENIKYVPNDAFPAIKNYCISSADIYISVAGNLGTVGKVPLELNGANLTENADRITHILCNRDFLLYNLMSERIQNQIESEKTVGAQPKLALIRIQNFKIPLPKDRNEQRAIAAILSNMDAEIATLEAQRDKTRALKQGMMQELLTGRIRLV